MIMGLVFCPQNCNLDSALNLSFVFKITSVYSSKIDTHKIHSLAVYLSRIFSKFPELGNRHRNLVQERFLSPLKETSCPLAVIPCSHTQPQATTNLFYILIDLPIEDISYKWN